MVLWFFSGVIVHVIEHRVFVVGWLCRRGWLLWSSVSAGPEYLLTHVHEWVEKHSAMQGIDVMHTHTHITSSSNVWGDGHCVSVTFVYPEQTYVM